MEKKAPNDLIENIFREHQRGDVYRRVTEEIRRTVVVKNGKQVLRIMNELGLRVVCPKKYKRTTKSEHKREVSKDFLGQNFDVQRKDRIWLSDITYIETSEGWLYLYSNGFTRM